MFLLEEKNYLLRNSEESVSFRGGVGGAGGVGERRFFLWIRIFAVVRSSRTSSSSTKNKELEVRQGLSY